MATTCKKRKRRTCKGNLARGLLRTLAKGGPKSNNISGYVDTTYLAKGGPKRTN